MKLPVRAKTAHDPEKWEPVSRLREAGPAASQFVRCFGGRRQVGQDHAQTALSRGLFAASRSNENGAVQSDSPILFSSRDQSMIPKSGHRFSEKIMLKQN
ncbi:MAG: hypothetical protein J2P55_07470 [Rhizobiales bacterium]|nr:hypothetical protein [Hyphomicrobiales bacterium]